MGSVTSGSSASGPGPHAKIGFRFLGPKLPPKIPLPFLFGRRASSKSFWGRGRARERAAGRARKARAWPGGGRKAWGQGPDTDDPDADSDAPASTGSNRVVRK